MPEQGTAAPWGPISDELLDLPRKITPAWINDMLGTNRGWDILRANLAPARRGDEAYQASWRALWRTLSFDARWRQKIIRKLRDDQHRTHDALAGGTLTADEQARARKFIHAADDAINRLGKESDQPLSWAGAKFARYPPAARELVETLAIAITDHRAGIIGDEDLYRLLSALGIDPATRRDGISDVARERARAKYGAQRP